MDERFMDCFIMILLLPHLVITGYTVLRYIDPPKFLKLSQPPSDLDLYCMAEFENNMLGDIAGSDKRRA